MSSSIAQVKRLRGKSLRELRSRGKQELAKLSERVLGSGTTEMSDSALLAQVVPAARNGSAEATALLILESIRGGLGSAGGNLTRPTIFPHLARRSEIIEIMERRFTRGREALLNRAERAIDGQFDLLGFNNLSFGSIIDWRLEPTTGKYTSLDHWSAIDYLDPDVAGDKKVTWELNRHAHFITLAQAYFLTGDERYAASFISQAGSWMDSNPPNRGINWASSLELAFRSIAWLWALHLLAGSERLTPPFMLRLLKHLAAHGRHIESYLSRYFSPNTHLTGEALGLFYLGAALPEFSRAAQWREKGLRILLDQLPVHIRPDGVYFEQSTYYQRYTTDFYIHLVALAGRTGLQLPPYVEERLALSLDHLTWITKPDGTSPLIGDDDGGRLINLGERDANDFRDTLSTGAALFGRGDWKHVAGDAAIETLWLLGPQGLSRFDEIKANPPAEQARGFAAGGYFVMRDGWSDGSSYLMIDCGPHGADNCGHAHADALAFEFASEGASWLVDPGTFTYTGDKRLRDYFRTTEAHTTVTVDGQPQSLGAGPFSWNHIAGSTPREFIVEDGFCYFEGSHNGYERLNDPVTHSRSILFVKEDARHRAARAQQMALPSYVIVRDTFKASQQHRYAARYHFSAECSTAANGNGAKAGRPSGEELDIFSFARAEAQTRIEEGWVSRTYGQRQPAPVAVIEAEGKGDQELVSFLIPSRQSVSIEQRVSRTDASAFRVSSGEIFDITLIGNEMSGLESDSLAMRGSLAFARFSSGRFLRGCLIRGSRLEAAGQIALHSPVAFRSCAIQMNDECLEITIHGGSRFDLSFTEPPSTILVNKAPFAISRNRRSAAFVRQGSGWELTGSD
jgi:Heparinase II/III-like protein/Heparinase II/III N-terminus